MTIDPSCWVELAGTNTPARQPRVTTDATSPTPTDGVPPVEGDVHVVTGPGGGSFVYDKDTASWLPLGTAQFEDNVYWGWGADPTVDVYAAGQAKAGWTPAFNEARIFNVAGNMEVQVYNDPAAVAGGPGAGSGYDSTKWETVTDIRTGDEYVDMTPPQTIYQLSP